MNVFDRPVSDYMSQRLETARASATVGSILAVLQARRLSAIPIVEPSGAPIGIVSRTDLIHAGLRGVAMRRSPSLALPNMLAADVMTRGPVTVAPSTTLRAAATEMVRRSIHRVLVVDDRRLVGVLSALDLAAATYDARIESPISAWMTSPAVVYDAERPVAGAIDLLDRLHVSGIVIVEDGWPVGIFSQVEALMARDLPRDTPVGAVHDSAMICLPQTCRVFRAAGHASQLDVRRVVTTRGPEVVGVLGSLDFARIAAAA